MVDATDEAGTATGSMTLAGWRLGRVLGRGGMGFVYEGAELAGGRRAAVKVLDRILLEAPESVERFRREARILARLDHPAIVRLLDAGEADGVPYLVTELLLGPGDRATTLAGLLAEGSIDAATGLDLFEQVLEGLDHAHRRGVVHRDLKPANVLVSSSAGRPVARLADFGVAVVLGERPAGAGGDRAGTPRYMAPEQAAGRADLRSDVYAAGLFLHEILTGELPGEGRLRPPASLRPVIARATARRPADRYPDAAALAAAVAAARADEHLDLDRLVRLCLAAGHQARALELEIDGRPDRALRHRAVGARLAEGRGRRVRLGRVAIAAGFVLAVAVAVLAIEARSADWASRARFEAGRRHLAAGELAAAERSLAGSDEAEARALGARLAGRRSVALGSVEEALARHQVERALDLLADRPVPDDLDPAGHARMVEAGGAAYLAGSIRRARDRLEAGDREGARRILTEATTGSPGATGSGGPAPAGAAMAGE